MAQGMEAMRAGDGAKLVAVLQKAKDPQRMLHVLGGDADDNRWSAMHGRAVMAAADYILAQPLADMSRFLLLLAKLRPLVAGDELAADLVARSGCHAWDNGDKAQSKDLYEVVRGCALVKTNAYYKQLAKHHR